MRLFVIPLLLLTALVLLLLAWGSRRWSAATRALLRRMDEGRRLPASPPPAFSATDLDGLPPPVQRYLRAVLRDGQRPVVAALLEHSGRFRMDDRRPASSAFTSVEQVRTGPPGFVWDGRIRLAPGLAVHVHDAYVAGEGLLEARLAGLRVVASQRGTGDLARGQLSRFAAEAPWYPTALLPAAGVDWEPLDAHSARAVFRDGGNTVALTFHFGADGLIETVRMEDRPRQVGEVNVPTAWEGRFWNYADRDGMLVPLDGEVAWHPPSGPLPPYWRGHLEDVRYAYYD
jgi:hypothetical protein